MTANKQKQTESSRNKRHGDQMFGQNWKLDEIGQSKVRSGSFWFVLMPRLLMDHWNYDLKNLLEWLCQDTFLSVSM